MPFCTVCDSATKGLEVTNLAIAQAILLEHEAWVLAKLLLIRHGHVEGIMPERFRDRADLPLTSRGIAEAQAVAFLREKPVLNKRPRLLRVNC